MFETEQGGEYQFSKISDTDVNLFNTGVTHGTASLWALFILACMYFQSASTDIAKTCFTISKIFGSHGIGEPQIPFRNSYGLGISSEATHKIFKNLIVLADNYSQSSSISSNVPEVEET